MSIEEQTKVIGERVRNIERALQLLIKSLHVNKLGFVNSSALTEEENRELDIFVKKDDWDNHSGW